MRDTWTVDGNRTLSRSKGLGRDDEDPRIHDGAQKCQESVERETKEHLITDIASTKDDDNDRVDIYDKGKVSIKSSSPLIQKRKVISHPQPIEYDPFCYPEKSKANPCKCNYNSNDDHLTSLSNTPKSSTVERSSSPYPAASKLRKGRPGR